MTICQLCKCERPLVNAHIIPRSFWNVEQNEFGPLAILSSREGWRPRRSQHGIYDQTILCDECDNKLGLFDQHAFEQLVNCKGSVIFDFSGLRALKYVSADPVTVHNFATSVAWRASKSKQEYFSRVSAGAYEKILQDSFSGDIAATKQLDCFIAEFDQEGLPLLNPQYSRMEGVRFLVIFANRFTFYIKVDRQKTPEMFQKFIIRSGSPVLSYVRAWEGSKQKEAMRQLVWSNPKPKFWKKPIS